MAFTLITGLLFNGHQVGYDDQGVTLTPTTPPVVVAPPPYVLPDVVKGRSVIVGKMPWVNGTQIKSGLGILNDTHVWAIPFTVGNFTVGRFAAVEFQEGPTFRNMVLIRNRDGATMFSTLGKSQEPNFVFSLNPSSDKGSVQLVQGETYTLSIWNKSTIGVGNQMLLQLTFS